MGLRLRSCSETITPTCPIRSLGVIRDAAGAGVQVEGDGRERGARCGRTDIALAAVARGGCSGAASRPSRMRPRRSSGHSRGCGDTSGLGEQAPTLAELVESTSPSTRRSRRRSRSCAGCSAKAVEGVRRPSSLDELRPPEIAAWRMTIPPGHRFEATQALRQVLARAVAWGMLDVNPAKQGVENPQRRRTEKRPFESWAQLDALAERLGPRLGPMVVFAAATGMRPGEWVALEHRDIDRDGRVVYVRRAFSNGQAQVHEDRGERPRRAAAGGRARSARASCRRRCRDGSAVSRPRAAATSTCTTSATATGSPPSSRPGSSRSGGSTISGTPSRPSLCVPASQPSTLSRYMGASLTMIDRHYGHLARDGREHAIRLLDDLNAPRWTSTRWTLGGHCISEARRASADNEKAPLSRK